MFCDDITKDSRKIKQVFSTITASESGKNCCFLKTLYDNTVLNSQTRTWTELNAHLFIFLVVSVTFFVYWLHSGRLCCVTVGFLASIKQFIITKSPSHAIGSAPVAVGLFPLSTRLSRTLYLETCGIRNLQPMVLGHHWRHSYFCSTSVFSSLEAGYKNVNIDGYKFTSDINKTR